MCVTHGLTSVNPKKHLIGHHVDWARGFPFEAFGLPDQYRRASPGVALFGFGYDERFLAVMGEPWPGVGEAERAPRRRRRAAAGRTVDEVRRERTGDVRPLAGRADEGRGGERNERPRRRRGRAASGG